ncbi:hypothetical protein ACQR0Z_10030 [Bradyrhizobium sp. HKCCYLS3077]|uniref:hypothetical protein n=1 Tax=unclassified Bradyrhizobium TaxID=2631580 RepID=UPI003EBFF827
MTVANEPGTGEIAKQPEAHRAGNAGMSAAPVVPAACILFRRRAMGEAFTRHSLRPLHSCEGELIADLGHDVPRERAVMSFAV